MRLATVVRSQPASWLLPALLVLGAIYVANYTPGTNDPYPLALAVAGQIVIGFVAPICAGLGAWEARRLRASAVWGGPHVRSHVAIAADSLWPVIAVGSAVVIACMAFKMAAGGVAPIPDAALVGLVVLLVIGHAVAGFALGLRLHAAVAVPTALMVSFLWMAFPRALEPLWIRHLTGSVMCCRLQDHTRVETLGPDTAATAVSAPLSAGLLRDEMAPLTERDLVSLSRYRMAVRTELGGQARVLTADVLPEPPSLGSADLVRRLSNARDAQATVL